LFSSACFTASPHSVPTRRSSDLSAVCSFPVMAHRRPLAGDARQLYHAKSFRDNSTQAALLAISFLRQRRLLKGKRVWFQYDRIRSEEHTSELQSRENLVCRLLLE